MKKLLPLMTLAAIVLLGCAKEEITSTVADNQQLEETVYAYVFNSEGASPGWELSTDVQPVTQISSGSVNTRSNNGNSVHAHGDFHGNGSSVEVSFSGTQNNGGAHGSAEVQMWRQGGHAHVILETECVTVDGNEAVYGGIVTEVIENTIPPPPPPPPCPTFPNCPPPPPPPSCNPLDLGSYVYFKVIDNGQGNNAPLDRYYSLIVNACNPISCDAGIPWFLFGDHDVENESDKIKVND